ncbi:MAG TPA: TetR/AcrR family transcriptional regulator [Polyangiaceae bacterium]
MSRRLRKKSEETYHHGDLRRSLVEAALRAIERHGVGELSLRALGRSLGVSPGAPYRHFATKEDLLAAVAVEAHRKWQSFLEPRVQGADDAVARLRIVVEAYVLFAVEHPAAFRVMHAPYATVEESAPELVAARAEGHAGMLGLIEDAQKTRALREGDPMQLALALWSTMHGLAVLLVEGQLGRYDRPVDAAKLAKLVANLLFEGLLRRE